MRLVGSSVGMTPAVNLSEALLEGEGLGTAEEPRAGEAQMMEAEAG